MSKKCDTCAKTVYPMEIQTFGSLTYHKGCAALRKRAEIHAGCFKCSKCEVRLRPEMAKADEKNKKAYVNAECCLFRAIYCRAGIVSDAGSTAVLAESALLAKWVLIQWRSVPVGVRSATCDW
jgi:hypothetical protein